MQNFAKAITTVLIVDDHPVMFDAQRKPAL
jgi:hypothetical protein